MKLLFVTSRNIDKNGGESALIMGRHGALYQEFGIETDIVFFHKDTECIETNIEGVNYLKCSKNNIYEMMDELLKSDEYSGIVSSGFYDVEFNNFIKSKKEQRNLTYIIDVHATIKEIYEYCINDLYHLIGTRILYLIKKKKFVNSLKTADCAFVVSDEEIKELNNFLPNNKLKYIKIRCGTNVAVDFSEQNQKRMEQRAAMGLEDELVFVFSGTKGRWQMFDETVDLFEQILSKHSKCKFVFYMNLADDEKELLYEKLGKNNVIIRWVGPEEMKAELCAYDIGVMLRENKWTNRVAFPNKFSDYIQGSLFLMMSKACVEPYKLAEKYKLELLDDKTITAEKLLELLEKRNEKQLCEYRALCKELVDLELDYNVQVRNNCMELLSTLKGGK